MITIGIMPARNEGWVIGLTARALLGWVDALIVLDHASTDETPDILATIQREVGAQRLKVLKEYGPIWEEMRHRQRLLVEARELCATYLHGALSVVMVDADEILTSNLIPSMQQHIGRCPLAGVMQIPWIQLRGSLDTFISGGQWAEQDVSMAFLDHPRFCWAARNGYDFHHRHPMGLQIIPYQPLGPAFIGRRSGGLMHLQMVSHRRLRAKQALYVMQETIRWPGRMTAQQLNAMYGPTVYGGRMDGAVKPEILTAGVQEAWWNGYADLMRHIDVDAVPWQEAECKRLMDAHGADAFRGLDLFGVL